MAEALATESKLDRHTITVARKDLPLSCPLPETPVWDLHPRVYLPIEKSGEAHCPYCGTHYVLEP